MLQALSYHDYRAVCALADKKDVKIERQYLAAIDSLFTNWTSKLGHDKICVLGFILSRTFKYGKAVAAIPFPAFLGGVSSERCGMAITSALKMSKNTLRTVLKELAEDGFLNVFFPEKQRGRIDNFTRYFEIDFKKLQNLRSGGSVVMGILRQPKPKKISENEGQPIRRSMNSRLPNLGDLSRKTHGIPKGIPTACGGQDEEEKPVPTKRILRTPRAATIKAKPQDVTPPPAQPVLTVKDILVRMQQMQDDAKARRDARSKSAKGATGYSLKKEQLQAVIDGAMSRFYPDLPRMVVTEKAFGAMKNHLKRSAPQDIPDFVEWVIRSWGELSLSHSRSARNRLKNGEANQFEAIPHAPHFPSFGFRMPFFLACYNNRKAENAMMGDREQRESEALTKARRAAAQAQQEAASLRALLRNKQPQEPRRSARVDDTPRSTEYHDSLEKDDALPAWESFEQPYKRK